MLLAPLPLAFNRTPEPVSVGKPARTAVVQKTTPAPAPVPKPEPQVPEFEHPLVAAAAASGQQPSTATVTTVEDELALAAEMGTWKTRDPRELVGVISEAVREVETPMPMTFLLSIAHAETAGKVLAVSPAGAVGLAQATPFAYLGEGFTGKVFITNDYLVGTRAYVMKKPLGDAVKIAEVLLEDRSEKTRDRARTLLEAAFELRTEGMDELKVLEPHAPKVFWPRVEQADAYNLNILRKVDRLIEAKASRAELKKFHKSVERDYRWLRNLQQRSWNRYMKDLIAERNRLLKREYGMKPEEVVKTRAYEAGEYLARELDARFSAREMARFLAAHVATKQAQAEALGVAPEEMAEWTAGLYNGGLHNIRRMRAGLISSLSETEHYMKRVANNRRKLDSVIPSGEEGFGK